MKKTMFALAALPLAVTGCFGPGEPVELPGDDMAAARTCFAAEGLVLRAGKDASDKVTYDEFAQAVQYPLVAVARQKDFDPAAIGTILNGADKIAEEIRSKDFAGAVPACNKRFGIEGKVALPEKDADATLSCLALAAFMKGAMQAQGGDFGDKGKAIGPLAERLDARMKSDSEVLARLIGGDTKAVMTEATRAAFAEGEPDKYLDACAARFPAK